MNQKSEYEFYKPDFLSAYKNNGKNIDFALHQVAFLRGVEVEHLKTVLRKLLNKLSTDKKYC